MYQFFVPIVYIAYIFIFFSPRCREDFYTDNNGAHRSTSSRHVLQSY